ncbi:sensor histidine kinase [Flavobacterium poyangense]|uniref:sensor histidine kinase n=1 Tax=Flavobacterium poyangense TaxID=2204302 RepID=UPI00141E0F51|nr:sensor histidine kinase [Flavobacterium sp. JXAS1]
MKLKIPYYYHLLLFLVLFIIYCSWDLGINNKKAEHVFSDLYLWVTSSFFLTVFIVYLFNFYTFCDWFLYNRKMLFYFLTIPVSLLLFGGLRYLIQEVIVFHIIGMHNYDVRDLEVGFYIRDNLFFGLPAVILSALCYLFWQSQASHQENQDLLLENKKAEFQMLKAQVSPHFLFNTLNSFYSQLISKEDEIASDILVLSDLLRYVITETDKDEAVLSREIQFIQNYIHLQKKRFEDQLYLDFLVEGDFGNEKVLSSALIHFIENVFKHGKLNNPEEKAVISIKCNQEFLEVSTFNYNAEGENYSSTGIGYENLIKRLDYTYKDRFLLEKTTENNTFKTYLKLPLKK